MAKVLDRPKTAVEIEELILELMARMLHEDKGAFKRRLLEQGESMPVDSLDLFDVIQEFTERTGIRIPVNKLRKKTMRSIRDFSEFVASELDR